MHETTRLALVKKSSGSILVVEDDADFARSLKRTFGAAGYSVEVASSAEEAFEKVTRDSFDLVITDLNLPGASGVEVLDVVRAYDKNVACAVLTGAPTTESAIESVRLGAIAYLVKPTPSDELLRVVERAVASREAAKRPSGTRPAAGNAEAFDAAMGSLRVELDAVVAGDRRIAGFEARLVSDEKGLETHAALVEAADALGRSSELRRRARDLSAIAFSGAAAGRVLFVDVDAADLLDGDLFAPDAPLSRIAESVVLQLRASATSPMIPVSDLRARVSVLRFLGFRIAICDIDAGASRLAQIAELSPEYVKLDAALVRDVARSLTRQRVVSALCAMCADLGATVVAEGVTTPEERAALVRCGCMYIQSASPARRLATRPFACASGE